MTVNNQYFSAEQVKAGQMQKLLDFLMSEAYSAGNYYNDIHIYPADLGAFIVEWVQVPWDHSYGGHFEYVDEDQIVMLDKEFPDGHYEQCFDEDSYNERLTEWLKENPGWVKTSYGTWTNEIENKKFQEQLENETKEACVSFDDVDGVVKANETHYENGIPQGE